MHIGRSCGLAAAILSMFVFQFAAASTGDSWPTLGWQDVAASIDEHPALSAAVADLDAAQGVLDTARQLPNLSLEYGRGRAAANEGGEEADTWELALSLPINPWGPYRHRISAAGSEREASVKRREALRLEIERRLRGQFWLVAHDQHRQATLARSLDQFTELVELARLRSDMGEARPLDPLRLEIELERLSAEIRATEREAGLNRRALGIWLDLTEPANFLVEAEWDRLPPVPALHQSREIVLGGHPSLQAADHAVAGMNAKLSAERAAILPGLELEGFVEQEMDAKNQGVSISLEIPIWNWNRGGIATARAEREAMSHRRRELAREFDQALVEAHGRAVLAGETIESYRQVILPKSRAAVDALERIYQVGEVGILDILQARRDLIKTELEMLAAILDFHLSLTDLHALIGGGNNE